MALRVLPGLNRHVWARESMAGITLLAIAVPLNIGYAQIAGLPPTAGLYALILPGIVFAVLASTRQLVASPDAAAAALVASSLGGLATAGGKDYIQLALAQAIIGAVFFGICAVFKLGFLANFLSEPILIGFVGGLALDILVSQTAKMLGVHINSGDEFLAKVGELFGGLGGLNVWSLLIAFAAVAILLCGRMLAKRFPWALIVLIISTVAVVLTGAEAAGVAVLGHVDSGPPVLTWPQLSPGEWLSVTPSAAALTVVAMAEGLLVARRYGQKRGYATSANRDLMAFGAANLAAGVSGGFTVGSSTSRTAAMDQAGSRTQLPTIITAVGTLALVVFGTALLEHVPSAAIGAIVFVAVYPLLGIGDFARLWRLRPFEFVVGAVCFLGALLLGPIIGIMLAFVLSLINLARRAAHPPMTVLADQRGSRDAIPAGSPDGLLTASGVSIVRCVGPIFFANAGVLSDRLDGIIAGGVPQGLKHLVLDCEAVSDVDVTGATALGEVVNNLTAHNVTLHLSRVRPDLEATLTDLGLMTGVERFRTNEEALTALAE